VLSVPAADDVVNRLRELRIAADQRDGYLRLSPHVFNDEAQIQGVLEALESCVRGRTGDRRWAARRTARGRKSTTCSSSRP
jgi:hypothetical protein